MIGIKYLIPTFVIILFFIHICLASEGDKSNFFQNCKDKCIKLNCTKDKLTIEAHAEDYYEQTIFDKILSWTCSDECEYSCMWRTVNSYLVRGWNVPQFYGKWPFVKFLGLQEPASVVFSIMNLLAHSHFLIKFRKFVNRDSPCYLLWHIFAFFCINGWIWSTVFHARDFPITELLDYTSAYSMVLVTFYCMIIRMIYNKSIIIRGIITAIIFSFYINYFAYLSIQKFSYSLNMTVNIITGILSGVGWLTWCFMVRKKRRYCKKMVQFYTLLAISMILEILDFAPILWIFDAHSLWHLSSVPLPYFIYNFAIDDCRALEKEKQNFLDTGSSKNA